MVARTSALVALAQAVFACYERLKAERGLIDFDDLIARTKGLFSRSEAAWVLYKLDSGIDHILVDEAQDTSPAQWQILQDLAADFTAGAGQRRARRTLFAVGDEKQSIYSFQGAAPHMFDAMRRHFGERIKAVDQKFEAVDLHLSFRSAPEILQAVDRVFGVPANYAGLSADNDSKNTIHEAFKTDLKGHVEIWPPIVASKSETPVGWKMPLDATNPNAPANLLATRVARAIAEMIAPGSRQRVRDSVSFELRAVSAGDVLILVRSRNAFFDAIIRALKDHQVAVAGADRLALTEHIAVMDLMAIGRAALLPDDDLTLACVLKSPLIGLDDDDLMAIAPARKRSLLHALQAALDVRVRDAATKIALWRARAQRLTPFAFYARLLGADGGRMALIARLGHEAGDAIDEFLSLALAHERGDAPSLANFLGALEAADLTIKRDMEAAGAAVRVMTVHGAKGLEAKIVFLPDTCARPGAPKDPSIYRLEAGAESGDNTGAGILAWSAKMADDPEPVAQARAESRRLAIEENRRLLYVAMTRAEERLYIGGYCGEHGPVEGCWHNMIVGALAPHLPQVPAPWDGAEMIWHNGHPLTGEALAGAGVVTGLESLPPWLRQIVAAEPVSLPPLRPSQALDAADRMEGANSEAGLARQLARASGKHLHVLMQYLPGLARIDRADAGANYLAAQSDLPDPAQRRALLETALRVMDDPRLETLFGEGSLAEVALSGHLLRSDGSRIDVAGQIDRLAVTADEVLVADFKTGRVRGPNDTPAGIVTQLALYRALLAQIYPGRRVRALVIWTQGPALVELDATRLDAAIELLKGL